MSLENIESFKKKGIFLIKNFYTTKELKNIKKNIHQIKVKKPKKFVGIMKYFENNILSKKKNFNQSRILLWTKQNFNKFN